MDGDDNIGEICRVCRMEGTPDRPLFYPCVCTGSIKYVHQECLMQWLKYSKKEFCELCSYKYTFQPIYSADMPGRLPIRDLVSGVGSNVVKAVKCWLHYSIVAVAWLGIVPLTACRIYRSMFTGSVHSLLMLPLDLLSTDNILYDCVQGAFILALSLCAFISLVWLREQIIHAGDAHWLEAPHDPNLPPEEPADNGDEPGEGVDEGGNNNAENADLPPDPDPQQAQQAQPEDAWQPFEWDRAAEDLTWERLLGLDGSLVFLEHVFWVISLNTLFILVFAFSPYHIGYFCALGCGALPWLKNSHFEGILTTLFGYLVICVCVFCVHMLTRLFGFKRVRRATGLTYLVLKVFLLVLMEVGFFPLVCGWWIDICSLGLFASTPRDRLHSLNSSPGTSMFIHWLVGMVYVFYFASFVLLLREVLRPGVLWFTRNLNDPEFNPIQEMIQHHVYQHVRRCIASLLMFAITILVMVYLPVRLILKLFPSLLPYNISLNAETPLSELSLELLLLQVVLPALLEQSQARSALKAFVRYWSILVGRMLHLTQYLLPADDAANSKKHEKTEPEANANVGEGDGAVPFDAEEEGDNVDGGGDAWMDHDDEHPAPAEVQPDPPPVAQPNLAAQHQALLLVREPVGFQPYTKPPYFPLRIAGLMVCLAFSSFLFSFIGFTMPVSVGRLIIYLVSGQKHTHELYTVAVGLYTCWLLLKGLIGAVEWVTRGWNTFVTGIKRWTILGGKCLVASFALLGVVPFMMGLFFQLVLVTPMRVGLHQTPLFFPWQDWAMGILHCKILCAGIMMGPEWWLKSAFERTYQNGVRNMNLTHLYTQLVIPVCVYIGLAIAIPYAITKTLSPLLCHDIAEELLLERHIYPCLLFLSIVVSFTVWQFKQLSGLAAKIRNEKYLVGQRLVNYERDEPEGIQNH